MVGRKETVKREKWWEERRWWRERNGRKKGGGEREMVGRKETVKREKWWEERRWWRERNGRKKGGGEREMVGRKETVKREKWWEERRWWRERNGRKKGGGEREMVGRKETVKREKWWEERRWWRERNGPASVKRQKRPPPPYAPIARVHNLAFKTRGSTVFELQFLRKEVKILSLKERILEELAQVSQFLNQKIMATMGSSPNYQLKKEIGQLKQTGLYMSGVMSDNVFSPQDEKFLSNLFTTQITGQWSYLSNSICN
uniref:Uncharacterized protein n=1 Tax=Timema cristinae TaxID=61476 RepID=A0A7R9GQ54_TIMCR|nr:unnamed protein product [Timema cristinae]